MEISHIREYYAMKEVMGQIGITLIRVTIPINDRNTGRAESPLMKFVRGVLSPQTWRCPFMMRPAEPLRTQCANAPHEGYIFRFFDKRLALNMLIDMIGYDTERTLCSDAFGRRLREWGRQPIGTLSEMVVTEAIRDAQALCR